VDLRGARDHAPLSDAKEGHFHKKKSAFIGKEGV